LLAPAAPTTTKTRREIQPTCVAVEEPPAKPKREDPLEKPVKTLVDSLGGVTSTLAGILATKVTEQPKAQRVRREVKRDKQGFIAEILEVPAEDDEAVAEVAEVAQAQES
jgi:hypothetical protein